jgi:hypothetical protein
VHEGIVPAVVTDAIEFAPYQPRAHADGLRHAGRYRRLMEVFEQALR